ncbi:MAG: methyltransferase domain-containing protein [Deltaproteobacteria bacterium]|nr:methyltransferase domain-containing protein [Deltaproteobacteria bacterium]
MALVVLVAALVGATDSPFTSEPAPKTYQGRVIAPPMSYRGAGWLDRADRDAVQQPEKVLDALHIQLGNTVADIGAGTGYFSLRLAKRVGPQGRVLATDIQPQMLAMLKDNMRAAGLGNIELLLCTPTDAKLPEKSLDLALMVDVYHELEYPEATLAQVRRALKPEGRLVLVEYRGEDPNVPIKPEHKTTLTQLRTEIEPLGWKVVEVLEFLEQQRIVVFGKAEQSQDHDGGSLE